ncbi:hypothetical protein DL240_15415 [Lujinxingia litoralis]|uniref:ABC transporter ATP-binding protein n=1 Tax=Lujinxingia litoralis TaxID=2211119 RepID=A0A328C4E4_9DELT|nr:FHA domain-containing protein [Lujinxingia litoralis]RAL20705.1 hypothetical protein DL240_15415 [Lujinxingia litoralis]
MSQRCPYCDAPIKLGVLFCPACGARPRLPRVRSAEFEAEVTRPEVPFPSGDPLLSPALPLDLSHAPQPRSTASPRSIGGERSLVIGRDQSCDIVLDAPQISRRHVSLTPLGPGRWLARDLNTANGTFVGSTQRRLTQAEVHRKDVLFLGSYRFPLSRIQDFERQQTPRSGNPLALPADKPIITLGRGPANDIVLQSPQVSRHHARLVRESGGLFLEDLSSANGTFVGGQRVQRAPVEHGQIFSLGSFALRLDLERMRLQKSYRGDILLQAENLRVEVPTPHGPRRLLDGISFTVYPTELVGLLGPSGAGKTTLLNALIAYNRPSFGRTLLNGDEIFAHFDRYRGAIGYVPQEDIIHSELTVYQALYYTAKLRLPPDTTDEEIDQRIWQVLHDLEISDTAPLRIGSPEQKSISGGQRKRVNLAMELLTDPSLLCLDEPTSGLASEDALNVMRLLRRLADRGKTILLTIHQPSLKAYRLMDNTLYLADGEQVYYGPAYPDSMLYFHPEVAPDAPAARALLSDPGSCMRPLVAAKRSGEPMETFAARYRQSAYFDEFVSGRRRDPAQVNLTAAPPRKPPSFELRQLRTLTHRFLTIKLKDRIGTLILLIQAPIVAMLLNLVFIQDEGGVFTRMEHTPLALFLLVISAIWFGGSNAAREIVREQAVYRRERMVNLSIPAYVASKFVVLGLLCLVQCVALLGLTYGPLDFHGAPLLHLLTLWLCALAGVAAGLLLSAAVRTSEAAIAMVPIVLIPQVILGGAIMPVARMDTWTRTLSATTFSRFGFEAMLHTEERALAYEVPLDELPLPPLPGAPAPPIAPHPLDRFFGDAETGLLLDLGALSLFTVVVLSGVSLSLRRRDMLS